MRRPPPAVQMCFPGRPEQQERGVHTHPYLHSQVHTRKCTLLSFHRHKHMHTAMPLHPTCQLRVRVRVCVNTNIIIAHTHPHALQPTVVTIIFPESGIQGLHDQASADHSSHTSSKCPWTSGWTRGGEVFHLSLSVCLCVCRSLWAVPGKTL